MKLFKYIPKHLAAVLLVFFISSCSIFDLDINQDPNNPTTTTPDLLLTNAELNMAYAMNTFSDVGLGFMGLIANYDGWNMQNTAFNGTWSYVYSGPLKDIEGIIQASSVTGKESPYYLGIGQVLKAYMFSQMVDMWGDIPYAEALQADAETPIKAPHFSKDSDVYADCIKLLDEATANFAKISPVSVKGDAIYGGSITKWKKFTLTLKLKLLMTARKAITDAPAQITALLADPSKLIASNSEDFQFQFSKLTTPDNRHPWYQGAYASGDNGFTYVLHQQMVEMLINKDPRFSFYFRRQTGDILDQSDPSARNTTPCSQTVGCQYGYVVLNQNLVNQIFPGGATSDDLSYLAGVFGRDRADPAGVPNDGSLRTMPGVYPCGGYYDVTTPDLPGAGDAPGGGIIPLVTYTNVLYYQIEHILANGGSGDGRALFEQAIRNHISKVVNFGLATDGNSVAPASEDIDNYVNIWLGKYDAAADNNAKLNVVMKQLWFSSWGSGIEIYNAARRTGYPNSIQEPIFTSNRSFPLRLPYPQQELNLNPNAASYANVVYDADPIFWDK